MPRLAARKCKSCIQISMNQPKLTTALSVPVLTIATPQQPEGAVAAQPPQHRLQLVWQEAHVLAGHE